MSRAPPFPTRPARSPSQSDTHAPQLSLSSQIRPLQISRSPSRSTTPSSITSPYTLPQGGPSRPQRSELRSRQVSDYNSENSSYRDSISTTRSDLSNPFLPRNAASNGSITPRDPGRRIQRPKTPSDDPDTPYIPTSVSTVLSAFQSAGARQRSMVNGRDDTEN